MQALRNLQQSQGAVFSSEGIPTTFNNAADLETVKTGAVLFDRSHWGLLQMSGGDRLRFIHNQTTNTFTQRQPGEGCDTVFVTSTARTIDLTTVYLTDEALLILTSPGQEQRLMTWMDRYIFPADQVSLANLTEKIAVFSLVGSGSAAVLKNLGIELEPDLPTAHHRSIDLGDMALRLAVGSGLALAGYTLLIPVEGAASVWQQLTDAGLIPVGELLWQQLRVQQGRPTPERELTDDYNPLEAGLWNAISFDKGCYIGQETIARLNTYQGVKQQLWGLQLSGTVDPGEAIFAEDEKVGLLTSVVETPGGLRGLGYIRTKAGGAGLKVSVGAANGVVVDVPYLARGYLTPNNLPV
ncbi:MULTISPECIES: folate-binding protein YgfZ [Cyanophyceae]|nr:MULTISPECIES: folate-binding protein YgfZ [Cyanophyceae]MBD1916710.1 folate-binding protein YgfZ [Phormidium sp. FACHB-77]MBD2031780.1 folate-binding protein YgfZ [Phormidium sp. FACHB-322]MBD2050530.1 folate-binding protein YgfZ [Leptolyngbya sp. FACHB-60]